MRTAWAIKRRSENRLDGKTEGLMGRYRHGLSDVPDHVAGNNMLLFKTRDKAREFVRVHYAFLRRRPDLRAEPHGWLSPQIVKVHITIEEIPPEMLPRRCLHCDIYPADVPSDLCPGCEAYQDHQA